MYYNLEKELISLERIRKFMLNQKLEDAYFEVNPENKFNLK